MGNRARVLLLLALLAVATAITYTELGKAPSGQSQDRLARSNARMPSL